jgi:hypothetical protein
MSSAEGLGVLRSGFDQRPGNDPPPQSQTPGATGSAEQPAEHADSVGPIQVLPPRAVTTPHASESGAESGATRRHDLDTARGILMGVVLGSLGWGLIAGLLYMLLA